MLFIVDNTHYFQTNSCIHKIDTRHKNKLHVPSVRLSTLERAMTYSVIKIFNKLPLRILELKKLQDSLQVCFKEIPS